MTVVVVVVAVDDVTFNLVAGADDFADADECNGGLDDFKEDHEDRDDDQEEGLAGEIVVEDGDG